MARPREKSREFQGRPIELSPEDSESLKRLLSLFGTSQEAVLGLQTSDSSHEDSELLFRRAQWMRAFRLERHELLPDALFGEPAWDILIELYLAHGRQRMSTTALAEGTGVALATLIRWVHYLTQNELVAVTKSSTDARIRFIDLSEKGLAAMTSFLRNLKRMPD